MKGDTMNAARWQRSGGSSARTIEQVVRVQLLLLALVFGGIAVLLISRGGPAAWAAIVIVGVLLVSVTRLVVRLPPRELLRLGQHGLLVLFAVAFVGLALGPRLGFYRTLTVLSGSMRPTFDPGDVIIVTPEPLRDVRAGQVISFNVPGAARQLETHRVIKVLSGGDEPVIQTQGDANNWRDPWTAKLHGQQAWKLTAVVPYAGYVIGFMRSPLLHLLGLVVAPALFALLVLAEIWGVKAPRRRAATAGAES